MGHALKMMTLSDLGLVRLRGVDAVKFLQGQLSNDVARVTPERSQLAGYHNPQGRAIALLRLIWWQQDDLLAVLPRELAATVCVRLSKYVLRAKIKITDESDAWQVYGLTDAAAIGPSLPLAANSQARLGETVVLCVGTAPARWLAVAPAGADATTLGATPEGNSAAWQQLEVAAGAPQVFAATSEEFVAQMLNLDRLDAIAFDKGCYTGQEVIARAHYRGRVKRRMQRFVSELPCQLAAGDAGQLQDGRTFKVVRVAPLPDGRVDFLAVTSLPGAAQDEPAPVPTAAPDGAVKRVPAHPTSLPYSVPDTPAA